ncbi:hypothetical protein LSO4A_20116 [Candidatus Liberibacter solanacearum]
MYLIRLQPPSYPHKLSNRISNIIFFPTFIQTNLSTISLNIQDSFTIPRMISS